MAARAGGLLASLTFVAAVGFGSGCSSSSNDSTTTSTSSPGGATTFELTGTYVQPAVTPEDIQLQPDGKTATFTVHSGTAWHGDLEGDTEFVMEGVNDVATTANSGTIDETFTGTVAGVGEGHLHLSETFTVDPAGIIVIEATVLDGDADLEGLQGTMHFEGTSIPATGEGDGTYSASFTR